jgi:rSAM/selenodomain-associated transferase 1
MTRRRDSLRGDGGMTAQILVIAKAPVPGQVKTRLCPPCSPEQAAAIAAAALADTLEAVGQAPATRRVLVLSGSYHPNPLWTVVPQRGDALGDRLANAFADTRWPGGTLLIGMDTPQVSAALLADVAAQLRQADAILGLAEDGGWWVLGLRDPGHAGVLREVPVSTAETGQRTAAALRRRGLEVAEAPVLRDVDVIEDAYHVAALRPGSRFAAAVRMNVPAAVRR